MKPRAVVIGTGIVSPFGVGRQVFFESLLQGKFAAQTIRSFDATTFPTRVSAQVPVTDASAEWIANQSLDSPELRSFLAKHSHYGSFRDRKSAFAFLAGQEAFLETSSKLDSKVLKEAWICLGLGLEQAFLQDVSPYFSADSVDWQKVAADARSEGPRVRFRSEVDLPAQLLAEWFSIQGPLIANSSACAAGTMAIANAASWIERGMAKVVLCGGADSMVNPLGVGGMSRLGAPSPRAEASACRPFDEKRDGLLMGEGSAIFFLAEESWAVSQGFVPLVKVLGWGITQDGYRATAPRPDGLAAENAMRKALAKAALRPEQIGYINAHGTGTPLNDPAEARAIRAVFGEGPHAPWVSSIKGAIGHWMAGAGAIEFAACMLPFLYGVLPGTAHLDIPEAGLGLNLIGPQPLEREIEFALSNSFGFGGQNASLILGRA